MLASNILQHRPHHVDQHRHVTHAHNTHVSHNNTSCSSCVVPTALVESLVINSVSTHPRSLLRISIRINTGACQIDARLFALWQFCRSSSSSTPTQSVISSVPTRSGPFTMKSIARVQWLCISSRFAHALEVLRAVSSKYFVVRLK